MGVNVNTRGALVSHPDYSQKLQEELRLAYSAASFFGYRRLLIRLLRYLLLSFFVDVNAPCSASFFWS